MPPKVNESMQYRENRLETFQDGSFQYKSKQKRYWTHSTPDIVQLVDCGFYFTPTKINNDQITCVCCRKKETNVEGITNIADYHLTNNPLCPLALIISSQINHLSNNTESFWSHQPSKFSDPLSKDSIDLRKRTFGKYWKYDKNKGSTTTSTTLAKAGFYYCPLRYGNDRVQCVYCNCSLDTWLSDDDPIEEHKNNSNGSCYFLEKVDQPRPRSRSNSRSLLESENKEIDEKKIENLNINKAHRTTSIESNIKDLTMLSGDDSTSDDFEETRESNVLSKKTVPKDSPKKINRKSSSNDTKYKVLSQDKNAILEGEYEYPTSDNRDDDVSVNELADINSGRMTRSQRRNLAREYDSKQDFWEPRGTEEKELGKDNDNEVSVGYDKNYERKSSKEQNYRKFRHVDKKEEEEYADAGSEEEEKSSSDYNNNSINTKYSHEHEISNHNEGTNLHNVDEIEEGTLPFTDNDIKTEIPMKDYLNKEREFPRSDPAKTSIVSQGASEREKDNEAPQKLTKTKRGSVSIEYTDDDNDDDDGDDNDDIKDIDQLGSDDLNEFDDISYHQSESDSSNSSARSNRSNQTETKRKENYRDESRKEDLVNESISSRTRKVNKPYRVRKRNIEVKNLVHLNSDTSFDSTDIDDSSKLNFSFQTENSDDIDYHVSDDKDAEISNEIQKSASADKNAEKLKKRSRKEMIDNVSFDDERFKQVLESPKKAKKLKITDKRYSPSPPIYDLSNQNIGDYQEDNIHFLENDIRPSIRNGSINKPGSHAPVIKAEQSNGKTMSASPKVNKMSSGSPGNSNGKRSVQSRKKNKYKGQNESKKTHNNILDMSFDDSSNDIFDNNSKPFTFDIRNPLSKPAKIDINETDKSESAGSILKRQKPETNLTKSRDDVENSQINDVLPSDISVSSDIQNEIVNNKSIDYEITEASNPQNLSKEIQDSSEVESMEDVASRQADDASSEIAVIDMEDASLDNAEGEVENSAIREGDRNVENSMPHEISAVNTDVKISPIMDLKLDLKNEHSSLKDDSIILSDNPNDSTVMSKPNRFSTDDHILKDDMESVVAKNLEESELQQDTDGAYKGTYNKEEDLIEDNRAGSGDHNELSNVEEAPVSREKAIASSMAKLLQQSNRNEQLGSQSAYDEYIQDMNERNNELRSSNAFSSPSKVSNKSEHVDNSAVTSIWKEISQGNSITHSPSKEETHLRFTEKELDPNSNNNNVEMDGIPKNEVSKPFNPRVSHSAIERFSGNFSNLLESSTPEKKKETLDSVSANTMPQAPLEWVPVSLSNLLDNLQNMEAASEYLSKSLNSKYDLHDDYDGELTNLISSMPEDEENMTIQEWVKHNATNCHKLAKQTCNEMIDVYKAEYLRAIKTLEQMPTSD